MPQSPIGLMTLAFVAASGIVGFAPGRAHAQEAPDWVAQANNSFGAALYARLSAQEGNLFFSPYSIETALTMAYAGARGATAQQMARALCLPPKGEEVHKAFGSFMRDLNAEKTPDGRPRGYQLSVANALWGRKDLAFLPAFLGLLKADYGAELSPVDFAGDTEGARQTINKWVEVQTRDKIKDLIQRGILDADTRLVLTNAIYFKGAWERPFEAAATQPAAFEVLPGKEVMVPMMFQEAHFGYAENDRLQALVLPYQGKELAMVILLPRKVDGLAELERSLTVKNLAKWLDELGWPEVRAWIPKFKATTEFELSRPLSAMGMPEAFSAQADLSGMTGNRDLRISKVVHKAYVDVNEEGTEAAAATGVVVAPTAAAPMKPLDFRADHPFLFLIRHERSGMILFMGRVTNPLENQGQSPIFLRK